MSFLGGIVKAIGGVAKGAIGGVLSGSPLGIVTGGLKGGLSALAAKQVPKAVAAVLPKSSVNAITRVAKAAGSVSRDIRAATVVNVAPVAIAETQNRPVLLAPAPTVPSVAQALFAPPTTLGGGPVNTWSPAGAVSTPVRDTRYGGYSFDRLQRRARAEAAAGIGSGPTRRRRPKKKAKPRKKAKAKKRKLKFGSPAWRKRYL